MTSPPCACVSGANPHPEWAYHSPTRCGGPPAVEPPPDAPLPDEVVRAVHAYGDAEYASGLASMSGTPDPRPAAEAGARLVSAIRRMRGGTEADLAWAQGHAREAAAERDEVTARTLHAARGLRKVDTEVYRKLAELLESFCAHPTAGEPVITIVARERDRLQDEVIALRRTVHFHFHPADPALCRPLKPHEQITLLACQVTCGACVVVLADRASRGTEGGIPAEKIEALAGEWEKEAERRKRSAAVEEDADEAHLLRFGASFETHHAERLRALLTTHRASAAAPGERKP